MGAACCWGGIMGGAMPPIGGGAMPPIGGGGMPICGGTPAIGGGTPIGGIPAGGAYIALFWRAVPELWRLLRPAAAPSRSEKFNIIALAGCNTLAIQARDADAA